jgi:hypothetical protein
MEQRANFPVPSGCRELLGVGAGGPGTKAHHDRRIRAQQQQAGAYGKAANLRRLQDRAVWVADAGGRAFHGAIIEWLSGAHPAGSSPPHEQEPAAGEHLELVTWRGRSIPVPRLEVQLAVAAARGLDERCTLIRHAMSTTRS